MKSRARWTTFLSRYLEELGWSWAYWEFSAGFGIYNPSNKTFYTELVDALLHNEMPEPGRYVGTPVYTSNFQTGNDGWNLNAQQGASAQLTRANNTLNISISNPGTAGWHVQLQKGNISLQEGKKYRYSFKAKAEAARSMTTYIGMSQRSVVGIQRLQRSYFGRYICRLHFYFRCKYNRQQRPHGFRHGKLRYQHFCNRY
jgi:endoglucanase